MKKNIAALIIAAAMISSPGLLKAVNPVEYAPTQYMHVTFPPEPDPSLPHWNKITYHFNGGPWTDSSWVNGERWFPFILANNWIDAYLYDWASQRYTDRMFVAELKQ